MNLPIEFTNRMREMLQEDYEDFAASYERPRKPGLRGNRLKDSVQRFEESGLFGMEEIPWALHGYYYDPGCSYQREPRIVEGHDESDTYNCAGYDIWHHGHGVYGLVDGVGPSHYQIGDEYGQHYDEYEGAAAYPYGVPYG